MTDWSTVAADLVAPGGFFAVVATGLFGVWKIKKLDVTPQEVEKSSETVHTASKNETDALFIAREAMAASAKNAEDLKKEKELREASEKKLAERDKVIEQLEQKFDHVLMINGHLVAWIRDIDRNWHVYRVSETAPPLPFDDKM